MIFFFFLDISLLMCLMFLLIIFCMFVKYFFCIFLEIFLLVFIILFVFWWVFLIVIFVVLECFDNDLINFFFFLVVRGGNLIWIWFFLLIGLIFNWVFVIVFIMFLIVVVLKGLINNCWVLGILMFDNFLIGVSVL